MEDHSGDLQSWSTPACRNSTSFIGTCDINKSGCKSKEKYGSRHGSFAMDKSFIEMDALSSAYSSKITQKVYNCLENGQKICLDVTSPTTPLVCMKSGNFNIPSLLPHAHCPNSFHYCSSTSPTQSQSTCFDDRPKEVCHHQHNPHQHLILDHHRPYDPTLTSKEPSNHHQTPYNKQCSHCSQFHEELQCSALSSSYDRGNVSKYLLSSPLNQRQVGMHSSHNHIHANCISNSNLGSPLKRSTFHCSPVAFSSPSPSSSMTQESCQSNPLTFKKHDQPPKSLIPLSSVQSDVDWNNRHLPLCSSPENCGESYNTFSSQKYFSADIQIEGSGPKKYSSSIIDELTPKKCLYSNSNSSLNIDNHKCHSNPSIKGNSHRSTTCHGSSNHLHNLHDNGNSSCSTTCQGSISNYTQPFTSHSDTHLFPLSNKNKKTTSSCSTISIASMSKPSPSFDNMNSFPSSNNYISPSTAAAFKTKKSMISMCHNQSPSPSLRKFTSCSATSVSTSVSPSSENPNQMQDGYKSPPSSSSSSPLKSNKSNVFHPAESKTLSVKGKTHRTAEYVLSCPDVLAHVDHHLELSKVTTTNGGNSIKSVSSDFRMTTTDEKSKRNGKGKNGNNNKNKGAKKTCQKFLLAKTEKKLDDNSHKRTELFINKSDSQQSSFSSSSNDSFLSCTSELEGISLHSQSQNHEPIPTKDKAANATDHDYDNDRKMKANFYNKNTILSNNSLKNENKGQLSKTNINTHNLSGSKKIHTHEWKAPNETFKPADFDLMTSDDSFIAPDNCKRRPVSSVEKSFRQQFISQTKPLSVLKTVDNDSNLSNTHTNTNLNTNVSKKETLNVIPLDAKETFKDTYEKPRLSEESLLSTISTKDYVYNDKERGIILIERHLPSECGDSVGRRSFDSLTSKVSLSSDRTLDSQSTMIYDWRSIKHARSQDPAFQASRYSSDSLDDTLPLASTYATSNSSTLDLEEEEYAIDCRDSESLNKTLCPKDTDTINMKAKARGKESANAINSSFDHNSRNYNHYHRSANEMSVKSKSIEIEIEKKDNDTKTINVPDWMDHLSDDQVAKELQKFGEITGPVIPATRQAYLRRLASLESNPGIVRITKTCPGKYIHSSLLRPNRFNHIALSSLFKINLKLH